MWDGDDHRNAGAHAARPAKQGVAERAPPVLRIRAQPDRLPLPKEDRRRRDGMSPDPSQDHRAHLDKLALPHHAGAAYRALLAAGLDALPTIRDGLRHESGDVRLHCCQFFDQFLIPEVMEDLLALLDDPDERVRRTTLHVLGCDRCKQRSCRPDEAKVLPHAIALLEKDPDAHVRAHAIGLAGRWVHTNPQAAAALARAQRADASPAVRKKAGWYLPGGAIHRRTLPKAKRGQGRRAPT